MIFEENLLFPIFTKFKHRSKFEIAKVKQNHTNRHEIEQENTFKIIHKMVKNFDFNIFLNIKITK